jgi:hypothetical protein
MVGLGTGETFECSERREHCETRIQVYNVPALVAVSLSARIRM